MCKHAQKTLAKSDEDTPVSQPMIHKAIFLTFLYICMHQLSTNDLISSLGTTSFKIVECHQEGIANWENLIYCYYMNLIVMKCMHAYFILH